jgi:SAM-dependent methyltransferase
LRHLTTARRLWRLKLHAPGRSLLEVGCGNGDFLLAAARAAWQVHAVEYQQELASLLRAEAGLDVRAGELARGLWSPGAFDAVAFWEVLEHLRDPGGALALASEYLRPGGVILLSFPTSDSLASGKGYGDFWAPLDVPRHLHFLNRATLERLCAKAGLQLTQYRTPLIDLLWCHLASSWRQASSHCSPVARWLHFAASAMNTFVLFPSLVVQACRGCGAQAVAVVRKPLQAPL